MRKQQFELFGHSSAQTDMFPDAVPQHKPMDFPTEARRRLLAALEAARAAPATPWPRREMGMWEILFPQMAGWLPDDERDQLCFEFAQEIERLKKAA